jgi:hypothetical protein
MGAIFAALVINSLPVAAQLAPAPPAAAIASSAPTSDASTMTGNAAGGSPATGKSPLPCEDFEKYKFEKEESAIHELSKYAAQLYDNAQLPQPYPAVLSSNVLPAEGISRLTIAKRVGEIEQSCVVAFLVDDPWGMQGLRRLPFRSINVEIFKEAAGTESTKIFFVIPDTERPTDWTLYKPATLILGAYKRAGGDLIFSFSQPVHISNRGYSRWGGIGFGILAYLCAALAAWRKTGSRGQASFSLSPVPITAGVLGDGSISQLQVFSFSLLIASLMFYLWLWTGLLSNISQDLLILMGITSAGAVSAKYTATLKSRLSDDTARFLYSAGWFSGPQISMVTEKPRLGDLLLTNNRLDVYKFQMAMFSLLVAIYILGTGATDLGEVKISETLLYLIGISQGVYVGGKAVSEREGALDDRVKSLIALKESYAGEPDAAKKALIAADYLKTATAARADFQAIMNIQVEDAKLRLV